MAKLHPDGVYEGSAEELVEIERLRRAAGWFATADPEVAELIESLDRALGRKPGVWTAEQVGAVLAPATEATLAALRQLLQTADGTSTQEIMSAIAGLPAYVRALSKYSREAAPSLPPAVSLRGRPGHTVLAIDPEFRRLAKEALRDE